MMPLIFTMQDIESLNVESLYDNCTGALGHGMTSSQMSPEAIRTPLNRSLISSSVATVTPNDILSLLAVTFRLSNSFVFGFLFI